LAAVEDDQTAAAMLRLGESIAHAEAVLKRGLKEFPNEAVLLAEEGELSRVLSEAKRAEVAFEKAFSANPRSTLIAKRLARIKRSKGAYPDARRVLQTSLEFNPAAQDVHYDLAMTIMESAPNADQVESDTVLYHLRRSFSPGDTNRQAQFWYARQLCISGEFNDARPFFSTFREASIPFREKREVQGILRQADGTTREFEDEIIKLQDSYGLVRCQELKLTAFFCRPHLEN
jgi:tetratricopeptide (TPR) repeat protein